MIKWIMDSVFRFEYERKALILVYSSITELLSYSG